MSGATPERQEVEAALSRLQASVALQRSPQLSRFLNYIVAAKLGGDEFGIKAYAIAVDVFGRPVTFDPQSDPIVRVQARRLRALIDEYYAADGAADAVRIVLPVGCYVPEFVRRDESVPALEIDARPAEAVGRPEPPAKPRQPPPSASLVPVLGLIVLVLLAILATLLLQPRAPAVALPGPPSVVVAEFSAIDGSPVATANVAGLAVELVTDLQLFGDIDARYQTGGASAEAGARDGFVLTGIARRDGTQVQVTASLRMADGDDAVWSQTVGVPDDPLHVDVDTVSRRLAEQLGSHRGPLFANTMRWLDSHDVPEGSESEFICMLLFERYRDSGGMLDGSRAEACVSGLLRQSPDSAMGLAMGGALMSEQSLVTLPPDRIDPKPREEAEQRLLQAKTLAPTSSFAWEQLARYYDSVGNDPKAEAAYASALQLNPANVDAAAAYARMLSVRGESAKGAAMALALVARIDHPPAWYYAAPAINALRAGQADEAMIDAQRLSSGDAEIASVVATCAAHQFGDQNVLNRFLAQLLDVSRFRRFGILPVLRQRVPDSALIAEITVELKKAGVSQEALTGPF